jgi:hypothetical protein
VLTDIIGIGLKRKQRRFNLIPANSVFTPIFVQIEDKTE